MLPSTLPNDPAAESAKASVLFIVNSLAVGGAEKHVVALLNTLDTRRIRPSLAYLKRSESLLPQLRTETLAAFLCCESAGGLDLKCAHGLAELVARNDVRALVCTNTYSTLYGYLARALSRRHDVKLVSVYHTTMLRSRKEKLQMLLYRWILKRCDLLVYVCENQRAYWRARGLRARQDEVVHNGIDVAHFTDHYPPELKLEFRERAGFSASDYVVGLCSALRPEKAHGDLLEALLRLRTQGLPAKGLLIGDGPERRHIERRIHQLGLDQHVCITGLQMDVRPWIACADVMTLVSQTIETFSLAALESMALAKPLVMTEIGGASEQVVPGETGFLYPPGDVDSLVHHLAVLSSEPLRAKVGAAAAARVQRHYTVDRMSARFEALLAEMTASAALAPRCSAQQAGGARVSLGRRLIRLRGVRDTLRARGNHIRT
jgi:glycosyltransferase involved in cell wall biosynthesis